MARRALDAIGQTLVIFNDAAINITVSIGAMFPPALRRFNREAAVGPADLALNQSRASGRNCAICPMNMSPPRRP